MNQHNRAYDSVLGLHLTTAGYAFALFSDAFVPVDWGLKRMEGARKSARCLESISTMLQRYRPEALVIAQRRHKRGQPAWACKMSQSVTPLAQSLGIDMFRYSRREVRAAFAEIGASTKHEIAGALCQLIPEFSASMPPRRTPWAKEHPRMALFDAAALAHTLYGELDKKGFG